MVNQPDTNTVVDGEGPGTVEELPDWMIECLSRLFSSISDPTRIRIVHALCKTDGLNVTELANVTGLKVSAISHQLRILRDRSLVAAQREGRSIFYSIADDHLRKLFRTGIQHAIEDCNSSLRRKSTKGP